MAQGDEAQGSYSPDSIQCSGVPSPSPDFSGLPSTPFHSSKIISIHFQPRLGLYPTP